MTASSAAAPRPMLPFLAPVHAFFRPLGYPLMRIATGLILMPHGAQKLFGLWGGDIHRTAVSFGKIGLEPELPLAWTVGVIELFGGFMLAIGFLTRPVAVAIGIVMLVAVLKVHLPIGFFWTTRGCEFPLLWGCMAAGIAMIGGGRFSVDARLGREF